LLFIVFAVFPYDTTSFPFLSGRFRGAVERAESSANHKRSYPIDTNHSYIPPTTTDKRGPCPGLNTMANHGYLPRNGIPTTEQLYDMQVNQASLEPLLANVVNAIQALYTSNLAPEDVDLLSIGGPSCTNSLCGPGMDGHCPIEGDCSLTRQDYYFGDNHSFNKTMWNTMSAFAGNHSSPWSFQFFSDYRYARYLKCIVENPEVFFGPLEFILMSIAAQFANHVFTLPGQSPTETTMASFFVDERFPDGWAPPTNTLTYAAVNLGWIQMYVDHPITFLPIGSLQVPNRTECASCFFKQVLEQAISVSQQTIPLANLLGFQSLANALLALIPCTDLTCNKII